MVNGYIFILSVQNLIGFSFLDTIDWSISYSEDGVSRRSNISVEFFELGFRVSAPGDLTAMELDSTLDLLFSRVKEQENNQLYQVCFVTCKMSAAIYLFLLA